MGSLLRSVSLLVALLSATHQLSIPEADESKVVHPVQDFLPHDYEGAYIDQVEGGEFSCQPDIALVVDMSKSMAGNLLTEYLVPLTRDLFHQLRRLPAGPEDSDTFGPDVHLVVFNREATDLGVSTRGKDGQGVEDFIYGSLSDDLIKGGSCISCGLDVGRNTLINGAQGEEEEHDRYVILISDGNDNDHDRSNPDTPEFAASENKEMLNGISHFVVGVPSKLGKVNGTLLSLISSTPDSEYYWEVDGQDDIHRVATGIVDNIAGKSCMGF